MTHPYHNVAIIGAYNTRQAKVLDGYNSLTIALEAALGALAESGIDRSQIDGIFGEFAYDIAYLLGLGAVWTPMGGSAGGIVAVVDAANAIVTGHCTCVLVTGGGAGIYTDRDATAPWTRPTNEFVAPFGMYTALEFALIARRHMEIYGTTPENLATVAATIRNNGHVNPEAVFFGRGPFTADDILASRMVADPFHILDCAMNAEGGAALLLTTADRAQDAALPPVYILGAGVDHTGPSYQHPPSWDLRGCRDDTPNGYIGRRAARHAFKTAGLRPADVDVCEFYDPFSFEIIRQFEAFEFCKEGEGGAFVMSGAIGPEGDFPTTTDGGLMSFGHGGGTVQLLQRVIRGVKQLQGRCITGQVDGVRTAMCSNGGAGALFTEVMLLGNDQP